MKKVTAVIWAVGLGLPALALAQDINTGYIDSLFETVLRIINNYMIPIVIGLAVLAFIWGLLKYIIAKDEDAKKEARGVMIYGVIAIFVMVSVWGLVRLLQDVFLPGTDVVTPPDAPAVPFPSIERY